MWTFGGAFCGWPATWFDWALGNMLKWDGGWLLDMVIEALATERRAVTRNWI